MSTGYNPLPASLPVSYAKLIGNQQDLDIQTGRNKPPLFTVEPPQSIQLVIDGKARTGSMTPFDFRVSINNNLFRSRMARVSRVVIPKPPNVTKFNNVITWIQWDGVTTAPYTCVIPPAFYNTTTLANVITACMTNASPPDDLYVCAFDSITRTFSVTYTNITVGHLPPFNFLFVDSCSFISRGDFLAHFPSMPAGSDAQADGASVQYSCIAGMIYTRYAIISSESFNQYSFSDSRTTTLQLKNNIICIVDMTDIYNVSDFDSGVPYAMVYASMATPEAPHLMITNPQRNMNDVVDISVQDEYGFDFDSLFDLGPTYPPNCLGVSLWMEVSF